MTLIGAQLARQLGTTEGQIKAWRRDAGLPVTRDQRVNRYEPEQVARWAMLSAARVRGPISTAGALWLARVYASIPECARNKLKGGG